MLSILSTVIVAAVFIANPEIASLDRDPFVAREAIKLEEAMLNELAPNLPTLSWIQSDESSPIITDELLIEDQLTQNVRILKLDRSIGGTCQLSQNLIQTSSFKILISNTSLLNSLEYQGLRLSPSKRYLLIWTSKRRQFRHSSTARYLIYDIERDMIAPISSNPFKSSQPKLANSFVVLDSFVQNANSLSTKENLISEDKDHDLFQSVKWFNSDTKNSQGDSLILFQHNDIYLISDLLGGKKTFENTTVDFMPIRITFTGKLDEFSNGIPDWLYEEEILTDRSAFDFSPQTDSLAFISFNDSLVDMMEFSYYGLNVIPKTRKIRYPKAGRVNPQVKVNLIDNIRIILNSSLDSNKRQPFIKELSLPEDLGSSQHYLTQIKWLTNDILGIVWLNRAQNESFILTCSRQANWNCIKNLELRSEEGWLEMTDDLVPFNEKFYLTLIYKPAQDPNVGSYKQVALISLSGHNNLTYVTDRASEVTAINGVDKDSSILYYTAIPEGQPGQRQVYWTSLTRSRGSKIPRCLTCDHYQQECTYNNIKISPSSAYYIFECDGPSVPKIELRYNLLKNENCPCSQDNRSLPTMNDNNSTKTVRLAPNCSSPIWEVENNQQLRDKLETQKAMPITMRLDVPIAGTNYSANVILLLPPQFGYRAVFRPPSSLDLNMVRSQRTTSGTYEGINRPLHSHLTLQTIGEYTKQIPSGQKYPMVVEVYGGPGSQFVDYRFKLGFGHYLASNRRIIHAMIDGRGSGFQGNKRMYELYHRLGSVEILDQLDVISYLTKNLSFIDSNRIGIWGWSYGGYAAASALALSNYIARMQRLSRDLNPLPGAVKGLPLVRITDRTKLGGSLECAASVAPVTNWLLYDTAYTERYMSSPYQNEQFDQFLAGDHVQYDKNISERVEKSLNPFDIYGSFTDKSTILDLPDVNPRYRKASLLNKIAAIDRKRFLLIHGTADDNVHFQQSTLLMRQLIDHNVMFETRVYPDQDHGINNRSDKLHLYSTLSNFFSECFDMAF